MNKTFAVRRFAIGVGAWLVTVILMAFAFGVFVNVEKVLTDNFPDYPGANFLDEVLSWAAISVTFIGLASLLFALPALVFVRGAGPVSFAKILALGATVGPVGACVIGAPAIAHNGSLLEFAALGLTCGLVGAVSWWSLFERSCVRPAEIA